MDHQHDEDMIAAVGESRNCKNKGSAANHHYIFENVVNVLKGREPITTNALEGLKVVEIIEKIYKLQSNEGNGR